MAETSPFVRLLSTYEWVADREKFGGYSGIVLSPDGAQFTMVSDRGHLIEGRILRHGDRILGVRSKDSVWMDYPDALVGAEKSKRDAEGLAVDAEGRLHVSLEHDNRILRREDDGSWSVLPTTPEIADLPKNKGLEALAIAQDGSLHVIPESSAGLKEPFKLFRFHAQTGWETVSEITRHPGFLPVGADFGPDGRFYLLERGFAGFGFFTQVRRFELAGPVPLAGELLLKTTPRRHDNLEGLSIWQSETGALRMTMVSDDNFNRFQKTELVEYAIL